MAKVSISEAARLAGISRQHLYKRYITPGLLTVEKDGDSSPMIDTSELLRVFGELKGDGQQVAAHSGDVALTAELVALRRLLADRDDQLMEAREREAWMKRLVGEVTGALRLLEHRPDQAGQIKKARETIGRYKEALDAERSKGFWARLFNQ
ncbi:MAG TPA: hypothetical protein VMV75_11090 [Sulfuricella sp.]|nr:hypothetical protein [Sulfuricella sp.]